METFIIPAFRFHLINYLEIGAIKDILHEQGLNVETPIATQIYIIIDLFRRCHSKAISENEKPVCFECSEKDLIDFIAGPVEAKGTPVANAYKARLNTLNTVLNYLERIKAEPEIGNSHILSFKRSASQKLKLMKDLDRISLGKRVSPLCITLNKEFNFFCDILQKRISYENELKVKYSSFRLFRTHYQFFFSIRKNALLLDTVIKMIFINIKELSDLADKIIRTNKDLHPERFTAQKLVDLDAIKKECINICYKEIDKLVDNECRYYDQHHFKDKDDEQLFFLSEINNNFFGLNYSERKRLSHTILNRNFNSIEFFREILMIACFSFCFEYTDRYNTTHASPCKKRINEFIDREAIITKTAKAVNNCCFGSVSSEQDLQIIAATPKNQFHAFGQESNMMRAMQ